MELLCFAYFQYGPSIGSCVKVMECLKDDSQRRDSHLVISKNHLLMQVAFQYPFFFFFLEDFALKPTIKANRENIQITAKLQLVAICK